MRYFVIILLLPLLFGCKSNKEMPVEFVLLSDVADDIRVDLRYSTNRNFMGRKIDGYESNRCYVTKATAQALREVQSDLRPLGMSLKVFDAYRPQIAVDHFVRWAKDLQDTLNKSSYYPNVPKSELFERGYIAARSGHTRGSTLDLTLVYLENNVELDMGTPWDFFSTRSWPGSELVDPVLQKNRIMLRDVMIKNGFKPYDKEWWHFTLEEEPFPDTYFNFNIR